MGHIGTLKIVLCIKVSFMQRIMGLLNMEVVLMECEVPIM